MSEKIKILVAGAANPHIPGYCRNFAGNPKHEWEIVALAESDPVLLGNVQQIMKDKPVKYYSDWRKMLDAHPDIEAVQKFYDAGRLIREYFEHHSDAEAKEVIGLFARTCHLKQPVMLAAYKFAKEFDPSEVSMLSGLENSSTGYRLSQTHLLYVMVDYLSDMETSNGIIRGVDRRISYLRRAVEGSLPPIVMRKLIASENKQLTGSGRGRTCRIPGTKNELLADMNEHLGRIVGKINQAWDNPEDPALLKLAMDMGDVSETTRCELIKVMEHLSAIMQFCERAHVTMNEVDGMYVRAINENAPRVVGGTSVDTAVRTLG